MKLKNIVLVHGYFLDGSAWSKVIPLLAGRGVHPIAVQLTLNSFREDVAVVNRAIEMQDGPVMLVGQSYGGAVITEAGNHVKVAALVYVAGAAPDSGQSVDDWWSGYATAAVVDELRPWGDAHLTLSRDGVRKYLGQDLSVEEADIVYATQGPLGTATTVEKISHAAWRTKPSWYLVTTLDHTVPPAVQQDSADRMGAEIMVIQASHLPMLSRPDAVATFIDNAAASFD
ncbi:alpha/beta hydrolase [Rhizobium leguminosarum]|uniref:alpha/beta hydrolase n=1 Tax=Rhizobium leguminosarum TaxID=384 RepID=UPI001AE2F9C6|nr:alpha/beta hydrolase [Rhizobium leguminosarum]MBP2444829.1 pimeloyl-ACP methyl ester carboxylesterase [Rhizobium leguminosarum]